MSLLAQSIDGISLRQVLPDAQMAPGKDVRVRSVSCDSRTCQRGDVFVAIAGGKADGHDFAADAVARGASAVVAERPLDLSVPTCLVADAREALGRICQHLAGNPSQQLRVIGVTGTNGKSTTSHMIAAVLRAAGHRTGITGTLGYHDSILSAPAGLTTPQSSELAGWLARMVANRATHAVVEVSSHAISQQRVAGIEFRSVCLTNLRRDHLDYHQTLASYHRAKTELFHQVASGGLIVINADDRASSEHAPLVPGGVLTVGIEKSAEVTGRVLERFKSEQTFLIEAGNACVPVRIGMIGDHNIYNALEAAAVGLAEGIDLATIARGLESVGHLPGRLERIECGQPFGAYVDFAHTSDALEAVLSAVRQVTAGRLICVFGAGGNRDARKRPLMGRTVETLADVAIVTSDNPRLEDPRAIAAEVLSGFSRPGDARWLPDRSEAITYALSLAGPDDSVVVAGRGHETHQEVGYERVPLDDREVVRRHLYNLEPTSRYGGLMSVANS